MNRDSNNNVIRKPEYSQVCVWPATTVTEGGPDGITEAQVIQDFEAHLLEQLGARVQYLEEITTLPDTDESGNPIEDTGGRIDTFFAMHEDDIGKAALMRLNIGIRWLEDVLAPINYRSKIYPDRVRFYQTWPQDGTIIETTEEKTMTEQTQTVDQPIPEVEVKIDPMQQMAALILTALKPQLKAFIEEEVATALKSLDLSEAIQEVFEASTDLISAVADEVKSKIDLDDLLDSTEFTNAVEDVVGNIEFSVEVGGRNRRYR